MAVPVLHVCDKFGVRGSSIHGVSRLFSWWFPRFDRARFDVSLCGLKQPEPASEWLAAQGIPVHHLGRGRFDPRILSDLVALARARGARVLHVHGYAAADFGRVAARIAGCKLVLHEHFADPAMPSYQALADRVLRALHGRGHRRERLDARVPGARAPRAARARAPHLERRAARRVRARLARAGARRARRARAAAGHAVVFGTIGRLSTQKGHVFLLDAAKQVLAKHAAARLLIVGDGDLMAPLREQAAGARHRRPHRLRRAPQRRARPARRARRLLHLVALRGHAARALRGHGGGQGDRLHGRRRLPRGAPRGRDGPAGPASDAPALATALARVVGDADAAYGRSGMRAREASRFTTCAPASTRCRRSTTTCCGRAEWP